MLLLAQSLSRSDRGFPKPYWGYVDIGIFFVLPTAAALMHAIYNLTLFLSAAFCH